MSEASEQSKELLRKALEQTELQEYAGDLVDIIDNFVSARIYQILREVMSTPQPAPNPFYFYAEKRGE